MAATFENALTYEVPERWFGDERSEVRILSPRPYLISTTLF